MLYQEVECIIQEMWKFPGSENMSEMWYVLYFSFSKTAPGNLSFLLVYHKRPKLTANPARVHKNGAMHCYISYYEEFPVDSKSGFRFPVLNSTSENGLGMQGKVIYTNEIARFWSRARTEYACVQGNTG